MILNDYDHMGCLYYKTSHMSVNDAYRNAIDDSIAMFKNVASIRKDCFQVKSNLLTVDNLVFHF